MNNSLIQFDIPQKPKSPIIFSFPHSGTAYKETIKDQTKLENNALRASEDFYVDKLFSKLLDNETYFIKADFPRSYVDVNRDSKEIDRKLFLDINDELEIKDTPLAISGYGVIPRKVSNDVLIYDKCLSIKEYHNRISKVYLDWHSQTKEIIDDCLKNFGLAFIVDCHSMPSDISDSLNYDLCDFVIGDLNGKSSNEALNSKLKEKINLNHYSYKFNKPFSGNFILNKHTNTNKRVYGIQFEIRRDLYMQESYFKIKKNEFIKLSDDLNLIFSSLKKYLNTYHLTLSAAE